MKAIILHAANTRDSAFRSTSETRAALNRAGEFYLAGEVEASDLEDAWTKSQNDFHPNCVTYNGTLLTEDMNTLDEATQDGIMMEIQRVGRDNAKYKVEPAKWNGEFAQRSSMVGDVVIFGDDVYVVAGCGFEWVAAKVIIGTPTLNDNPYKED